MKPPKHLKIGPHYYKVINDKTGIAADVALVRGSCHTERLTIALDANLPHTVKAQTLLHEVIHACLEGIVLDKDVDEAVCQALDQTLLSALRDNPELVTFLVKE